MNCTMRDSKPKTSVLQANTLDRSVTTTSDKLCLEDLYIHVIHAYSTRGEQQIDCGLMCIGIIKKSAKTCISLPIDQCK